MSGSICYPAQPCRCYAVREPARVCPIYRHLGQASQQVSVVSVVVVDAVVVVVLRVPWRWTCFAPLCCGVEAPSDPQRSGHGHVVPTRAVNVLR